MVGKLVREAPLIAGRFPVKFAAGKLVSDAPEPLNDVAETDPVTVRVDPLNVKFASPFISWAPEAVMTRLFEAFDKTAKLPDVLGNTILGLPLKVE